MQDIAALVIRHRHPEIGSTVRRAVGHRRNTDIINVVHILGASIKPRNVNRSMRLGDDSSDDCLGDIDGAVRDGCRSIAFAEEVGRFLKFSSVGVLDGICRV